MHPLLLFLYLLSIYKSPSLVILLTELFCTFDHLCCEQICSKTLNMYLQLLLEIQTRVIKLWNLHLLLYKAKHLSLNYLDS